MANRSGTTVEHGGILYEFNTVDDAKDFENCVNGGGMPGICASQFHCINKKSLTRERDSGLER